MKARTRSKTLTPIQEYREALKTKTLPELTPDQFARMKRRLFAPDKPAKRIPRCTAKRRREKAQYARLNAAYLKAHPFCQAWILVCNLSESTVIADGGWYQHGNQLRTVPRSTQIHHRNKCRGARLTDVRWFLAVSQASHDDIEANKIAARASGFLLPMESDADGLSPQGQALTTAELMLSGGKVWK